LLLVIAFAVTASGCTSNSKDVIKVGSKEFSEQLILGQITLMALENAGYEVEDKTNIAGSDKVRSALETGEIDVYWEYTGTAWLMHLQHDNPITDPDECYDKVKTEDAEKNLVWLDYAPFNNTYTIMMRRSDSVSLGIKSLSDLSAYMDQNPDKLIFASNHEFLARPDGFPALEETYGFKFGENELKVMETGIIFNTLKGKQADLGVGTATDGRLVAFDLVNLEDDKQFFPVYNPSAVVRKEVLDRNPEMAEVLNMIAEKLDTEAMTELNYKVDIEEEDPRDVAEEWLKTEGLIE
jgi:osmoprotectant transport system substrate-binding protein